MLSLFCTLHRSLQDMPCLRSTLQSHLVAASSNWHSPLLKGASSMGFSPSYISQHLDPNSYLAHWLLFETQWNQYIALAQIAENTAFFYCRAFMFSDGVIYCIVVCTGISTCGQLPNSCQLALACHKYATVFCCSELTPNIMKFIHTDVQILWLDFIGCNSNPYCQ